MTDQHPMTLRQRTATFPARPGPTLDERIARLEHELIDFGDRPRIAQALRAEERHRIETELADLRRQRAEDAADEPLDAA